MDKIWRFLSSISLKFANNATGGVFPQLATIANAENPNEYAMSQVEIKTKIFTILFFVFLFALVFLGLKQVLMLTKKLKK